MRRWIDPMSLFIASVTLASSSASSGRPPAKSEEIVPCPLTGHTATVEVPLASSSEQHSDSPDFQDPSPGLRPSAHMLCLPVRRGTAGSGRRGPRPSGRRERGWTAQAANNSHLLHSRPTHPTPRCPCGGSNSRSCLLSAFSLRRWPRRSRARQSAACRCALSRQATP